MDGGIGGRGAETRGNGGEVTRAPGALEAPPAPDPHAYEGSDLEAMAGAGAYHRWIRDGIAPWVRGDVAEIGAGRGSFSRLLLEGPAVRSLLAVEPSARMHALLAEALAGEPRARALRGVLADVADDLAGTLDAAVYVNVLEHVRDDAGELRLARRALRPGGHLVVFVPALRWLYADFDAHVGHHRRYHRAPLVALARGAGFEVVRARYFDVAGVLPWLVAMRWLRLPLRPASVRLYDRAVVPVMRRVEAAVAPPLGKNLLLVAQRP